MQRYSALHAVEPNCDRRSVLAESHSGHDGNAAALYAHYAASPQVARHVLYYLEALHRLGFQIGFISNSEISSATFARYAA